VCEGGFDLTNMVTFLSVQTSESGWGSLVQLARTLGITSTCSYQHEATSSQPSTRPVRIVAVAKPVIGAANCLAEFTWIDIARTMHVMHDTLDTLHWDDDDQKARVDVPLQCIPNSRRCVRAKRRMILASCHASIPCIFHASWYQSR
jgi:hypothetical protein